MQMGGMGYDQRGGDPAYPGMPPYAAMQGMPQPGMGYPGLGPGAFPPNAMPGMAPG